MNTKMIGTVAALGLVSVGAFAETSYETASVVESRAVYEVVEISTPQEQCWEEEMVVDRRGTDNRSNTPVVLSTILGGAIGNAVGHNKSNRRIGAVLGAVLGHSIGRDIMRRNERPSIREYQTVKRCETIYQQHEEERLIGYQVTYLYNGQEYSVRTNTDPGDEIRVRVSVQPVL
ncbi:MAG: glycine zipper 2TM domain-containing protein [Gammaproteobacteria bacterium]|nr:glycine zipper 2TM domain-containing protein [Gammaproteobacteria bacterium]MBL4728796.1 glycine zipper 2TM domain-containing protein [Gammaproteobacteria bacterium]